MLVKLYLNDEDSRDANASLFKIMLATEYRLKKSRDISRVFKRGQWGSSKEISVKTASNGMLNSRAVVVVSKKISKKAVVRNTLRRRISGILEAEWKTVTPGYDIVVTVREDVSHLTSAQLKSSVLMAIERAGLIHGKK